MQPQLHPDAAMQVARADHEDRQRDDQSTDHAETHLPDTATAAMQTCPEPAAHPAMQDIRHKHFAFKAALAITVAVYLWLALKQPPANRPGQ